MGGLRTWALRSLASLWRWFFPPKTDVPAPVREELAGLFPTLDFERVRVHAGVPLLIRFSWPDAMTLPGALDTDTVHVYVRPSKLDAGEEALTLLAHEHVHVQQHLAYAGGRGLGLFRAFWYLYLTCALRYGYKQNPLEDEAERFEHAVAERCTRENGRVTLCCDDLAFERTDVGFVDQFVRAIPGLGRLHVLVDALVDARPTAPLFALLAAPLLLGAAALLGVLGVGYVIAFTGGFLLLTVLALSLWYVAKAVYVALVAGWAVVCVGIVAVDAALRVLGRVAP